MVDRVQQGHLYSYRGVEMLAMESTNKPVAMLCPVNPDRPWLGDPKVICLDMLTPAPMKYFHGQHPTT